MTRSSRCAVAVVVVVVVDEFILGGVVMISQNGVLLSLELPSRNALRMEKRACICAWPHFLLRGSQNSNATMPARAMDVYAM